MNTLTRTVAVLVTLSLLISGLALAQNSSERQLQDALVTEAREGDVAAREAEIAAQEAQRQAGIALARVESVPASEEATRTNLANLAHATLSRSRWPYGSSGIGPVLVIPSAEIETRDLLTINEDLNVMSRIFATDLQRAHISPSGGSPFVNDRSRSALLGMLSGRGRGSIQSLYLQGYGVLFLMKVDFPLSPPHQVQQQDEAEQKEEGDKVWEDTRRQLYEPEQVAKRKTDDSAVKYDAEKVENLKTTLIKALKHAANIRNLKPEEAAIISITGGRKSAGVPTIELQRDGKITATNTIIMYDKERGVTKMVGGGSLEDHGLSSPTVLVIRAKKTDVDSFAKGDLDLEQFRQRVQMLSYPYLHGGSQRSDILNRYKLSVSQTAPSN